MSEPTLHRPILIVEDSDDDYEVTERALKRNSNMANSLYRCEDGQEAMDFLLKQGSFVNDEHLPPGLILLDLNMPGKDGRQVLAEIKAHDELRHIPVVVLTTSDDQNDIEECYKQGASSYIKKPVDLSNFFAAIDQLKDYWFGIVLLPKG